MNVCFSNSLLTIGSRDIGLYPDGLCLLLLDFGIGTTLAVFHSLGSSPLVIDRLNKHVNEGAILLGVSLSIRAEMLSSSFAFPVSIVGVILVPEYKVDR